MRRDGRAIAGGRTTPATARGRRSAAPLVTAPAELQADAPAWLEADDGHLDPRRPAGDPALDHDDPALQPAVLLEDLRQFLGAEGQEPPPVSVLDRDGDGPSPARSARRSRTQRQIRRHACSGLIFGSARPSSA